MCKMSYHEKTSNFFKTSLQLPWLCRKKTSFARNVKVLARVKSHLIFSSLFHESLNHYHVLPTSIINTSSWLVASKSKVDIDSSFSSFFGNLFVFKVQNQPSKPCNEAWLRPQQSAEVILLYGLKLEWPKICIWHKVSAPITCICMLKHILGSLPQPFSLFVFPLSLYFKWSMVHLL